MKKILLVLAIWMVLSGLAVAGIGVDKAEVTFTHHFYTGSHYHHYGHPGCVPPPPPRWR